ncbi:MULTISPECIES: outer membrane beta-barrel family protein [Weeksella]|uniref:outer membrane beta-barrel family protein n=1 Tax=Weeksella TaxID=1013 RepID=UPI0008A33BA9|nr:MULTISPECIES: outer membrane beta-barrel family protein [Weeksella]MDK7374410.1 outer membrane beta-barrel family protein [Weeksella virosa]OFM81800.1 TonB-dependent receptor [Weeksella sp. HMSC059D05]
MKLRKLSLVFAFTMLSFYGYAQQGEGKITGQIQNEKTENLPLVNVSVFDPITGEFITEADSDENGTFTIEEIADGKYKVKIIEFGYQPIERTVEVKDGQFAMGQITLIQQVGSTIELKGAFVRAQVSQYRNEIDKRVVEVGNDLVSAGATAVAVLNNIPSVNVDQQTGNISLRGNENVNVYLDGKPSSLSAAELLKQLPSNQIQRVEIITNPSAKYEADGKSGIINIITIKQKNKGYNIGLNLGVEHGEKTRHTSAVNANLNVGSFNFFGNFNYNHSPSWNEGSMTNQTVNEIQDFYIYNRAKNINYKFGFDWFISDKTALTIYTNQYDNKWDGNFDSYILSGGQKYLNVSDIKSKFTAGDYSLNLKHDFDKENHNIVLDAFYSNSKTPDNRLMTDQYERPLSYHEARKDDNSNLRINLDYENQIIDGGKIEAGIQFRQEKKDNTFSSSKQMIDINHNPIFDSQGNAVNEGAMFDFTRNFYSVYLNYKQKFGKFGMQVGLRGEQTEDDAAYSVNPDVEGNYKKDYFDLFPSAFLTYDITDRGQLTANYSRRITRPGIYQLTPVRRWSSPLMTHQGNPELKPEYTDAFELGLLQQLKKGSVSANAFYRHTKDNIMFSMKNNPDKEGQVIQTAENYSKTNEYGFEASFNYRLAKWFSTFVAGDWTSMNFFNTNLKGELEDMRTNRFTARMSNTFTLSKNFSIQHFAFYQGPFENFQGKMHEMWRMDLGVRYSFIDGRASLSARMNDVLDTMKAQFDMTSPYVGTGQFQWESQTFYVGFTYNFGGKVRTRKEVQQNKTQAESGISLQ